jgi:hypothetical protein
MSAAPVTPDIGTTINDGYSRGLERLGAIVRFALVPVLVVGAVYALTSWLQGQVLADSVDDALESLLNGGSFDSTGDRALYNLLSIAASVVGSVIGIGLAVVIVGALHRERHGAALELPSPGASLGATWAGFQQLLPRYWALVLLPVVGTLVGIASTTLGGLVQLVAMIAAIWLGVRWVYAPVLAGSGEETGDAAITRSEQLVEGAWWRTFGIYFVVSLAIFLPAGIAGAIIGAILGKFIGWIGLAATIVVVYAAASAVASAALESAWHQLETAGAGGDEDVLTPPQQSPPAE